MQDDRKEYSYFIYIMVGLSLDYIHMKKYECSSYWKMKIYLKDKSIDF
jgi:hypothetical protein